ncbi:hypothetical protein [Thiofilum flexile]|uniref:hypothetical protein n=1 Tax=Thiofilum flexile TaxID=125627 RepID=UPI0003727351|nr:hypothetical protein [Thiofilum flexile]
MDKITSVTTDNRLEAAGIKGINVGGMQDNRAIQLGLYFIPVNIDLQKAAQQLAAQYISSLQAPNISSPHASSHVTTPTSLNTLSPSTSVTTSTATPSRTAVSSTPMSNPDTLNSEKLHIAEEFRPVLQQIQTHSYGNSVLKQILSDPNLDSLTIQPHTQSAAERKRLGIAPSAKTDLTFYSNGKIAATVSMDADMLAQVMTPTGQGIQVDADNILFHELAHVLLELNHEVDHSDEQAWLKGVEEVASNYEGNYGGYQRDYFRDGGYAFWG